MTDNIARTVQQDPKQLRLFLPLLSDRYFRGLFQYALMRYWRAPLNTLEALTAFDAREAMTQALTEELEWEKLNTAGERKVEHLLQRTEFEDTLHSDRLTTDRSINLPPQPRNHFTRMLKLIENAPSSVSMLSRSSKTH